MARTFQRICIKDYTLTAQNGDCLQLKRGKEYITSPEQDGQVRVFSSYWAWVPADIFAGEQVFTAA